MKFFKISGIVYRGDLQMSLASGSCCKVHETAYSDPKMRVEFENADGPSGCWAVIVGGDHRHGSPGFD